MHFLAEKCQKVHFYWFTSEKVLWSQNKKHLTYDPLRSYGVHFYTNRHSRSKVQKKKLTIWSIHMIITLANWYR